MKHRGFGDMLVLYAVGALAALLIVGGLYKTVAEHFREEGRAQVRAELAPLIDVCKEHGGKPAACAQHWRAEIAANVTLAADVEKMRAAVNAQNAALAQLEAESRAAQEASQKALEQARKRVMAAQGLITQLKLAAATPAASPEEACHEADRLLSDLAARRVRDDAARVDRERTDGNGARAGPDAVPST